MVGFIMLTRLSYEKAIRQYAIAICASVITIVIPVLIRKVRSLRRLTWLYAIWFHELWCEDLGYDRWPVFDTAI